MSKRRIKVISVFAGALFTTLLLYYDGRITGTDRSWNYIRVVEVNDGDTVSIVINRKIEKARLIGIDAPELGQKRWGPRAKRHLENIMEASSWKVLIELDLEQRDKYGRLLVYLWTKDRQLINLKMLKDGYAMLYTIPPNVRYVDILNEGQQYARQNKLGIWGRNGMKKTPQEYRREHPRQPAFNISLAFFHNKPF